MSAFVIHLHAAAILAADTVPADEDVVAGAWGAATFVGLLLALGVIGYSLNKHLRKAQNAKDAGAFGDEPAATTEPTSETNQSQQ